MEEKTLASGAEAVVCPTNFLGRRCIVKKRTPKGYRLPELDIKIRGKRIRQEARMLREARKAGVRTPVVYSVDSEKCELVMEFIEGTTAKDYLQKNQEKAEDICEKIGYNLALLHNNKIAHGDLTTSNIIIMKSGELCFIDFSMGTHPADIEDMGVDMGLLERAFSSAHPGMEKQYEVLINSYKKNMKDSEQVFGKLKEIRSRGRYT